MAGSILLPNFADWPRCRCAVFGDLSSMVAPAYDLFSAVRPVADCLSFSEDSTF